MGTVSLVPSARARLRQYLLSSPSAGALLLAFAAGAQPAAAQSPAQSAQAPAVEEIVVTGTRIVRNGYDSPTPLTVVSAESLQQSASTNIADVMRQFPTFAGSTTPQSNFTS